MLDNILIPLQQVPITEIRHEIPDRAMAPGAFINQHSAVVHGAFKNEKQEWKVVVTYTDYDGKIWDKETLDLKRTGNGILFITVLTQRVGSFPIGWRDVYLE